MKTEPHMKIRHLNSFPRGFKLKRIERLMIDKLLDTFIDALHDIQRGFSALVRPIDLLLLFAFLDAGLAFLTISFAEKIAVSEHPFVIAFLLLSSLIGLCTSLFLVIVWAFKNWGFWREGVR